MIQNLNAFMNQEFERTIEGIAAANQTPAAATTKQQPKEKDSRPNNFGKAAENGKIGPPTQQQAQAQQNNK